MTKKSFGQGTKYLLAMITIIFAVIFCGGSAAAYIMLHEGIYENTKEKVQQQVMDSSLYTDAESIHDHAAYPEDNAIETSYDAYTVSDTASGNTDMRYTMDDTNAIADFLENTYGNSNLRYEIYKNGEKLYGSTKETEQYEQAYGGYYVTFLTKENIVQKERFFSGKDAEEKSEQYISANATQENNVYVEKLYLRKGFPREDHYRHTMQLLQIAYEGRYPLLVLIPASFLFALLAFVALLKRAGHRRHTEEIVMRGMDRIPTDLFLAGAGMVRLIILYMEYVILYEVYQQIVMVIGMCLFGIADLMYGLYICMGLAVRVKTKTLWKNSICGKILHFFRTRICYIFRKMPLIQKGVIVILGICFLEFIGIGMFGYTDGIFILWFLEKMILLPFLFVVLINLREIQKGTRAMVEGRLEEHMDTKIMYPVFKEYVADLNQLRTGLNIAVEGKIKSERFKTELITNVSHDIKTPLTSIINYVDLIEKQEIHDEQLKGYVDVLKRQSLRLKKLIEDLIEASKASTGNVKVNLKQCDVDVLLTQTIGEFKEKLEGNALDLQLKKEIENAFILADGRHLWRIFDNLLNNIYKYAQPGTRVYLNLEKRGDKVCIIFKNTSKYQLNITSEELMQRFVRGDSSRNTEGTGLGLSIASNLTELMGGTFTLDVDGDLFKVTLEFDIIQKTNRADH